MESDIGRKFIEMPSWKAYGIWIVAFSPALIVLLFFIFSSKYNTQVTTTATVGILSIISGYLLRTFLVRNMEKLKNQLLASNDREKAFKIISGGWVWCLMVIIFSTIAIYAIFSFV